MICNAIEQKNIIDNCVNLDGTSGNFIVPFAFRAATKGNNPDVLSCRQMMKIEDQADFLKAEVSKLTGLDDFGVFEYFKTSEISSESRGNLLNAIWSYLLKRRPDSTLLKYKSRVCAEGSQQQDCVDYFDNKIYSPVVQ